MNLLYEAAGLRKSYAGALILDVPELQLNKGENLILTGANGSGKSTLLRILAFLEKPDQGRLVFYGDNANPRRQITLMLQEPWLMRSTVFRNVTLGLALRKETSNLKEKFLEVMRAVGFSEPDSYARRYPYQLSGGEKQRITLASRMILKPVALLLDEPTAYVDAASAQLITGALRQLNQQGSSIICATHDPQLIQNLSGPTLNIIKPGVAPAPQ